MSDEEKKAIHDEDIEDNVSPGFPSRLALAAIQGGASKHSIASSELQNAFTSISFVEPLDSDRSSSSSTSDVDEEDRGRDFDEEEPMLSRRRHGDDAGPTSAVAPSVTLEAEAVSGDSVRPADPGGSIGENDTSSISPERRSRSDTELVETPKLAVQGMRTMGLVSVVYFLVCGGAYGTEDMAGAIPPLFALLGILLVPWLWSLPTALVTAELATTFPSDTGFVGWTRAAWGPRLAFVDGFIMTQVVIIDQALYPTIFVAYLRDFLQLNYFQAWIVSVLYIAITFIINLFGAKGVSRASAVLQVIALFPFALFFVLGTFSGQVRPSRWLSTEGPWRIDLYISVLIWATCGWEYAGFVASQVRRPSTTFPRAMAITVVLMVLTYLAPIMVAIGTVSDPSEITAGWFPRLGKLLGLGDWVGTVIIIGGLGSTAGTYLSYLLTSSSGLRAVAKEGGAPKVFAYLDRYEPPVVALLFYSLTTCIMVLFEFDVLVQLETFFFCVHTIILMSLLPRLRRLQPQKPRPFRVGCSWAGQYLLPLAPCVVALYNLFYTEWSVQLVGTVIMLATYFGHWGFSLWKGRRQRHHHHHHHHRHRDRHSGESSNSPSKSSPEVPTLVSTTPTAPLIPHK